MMQKCNFCQLMTRARLDHKLPLGASLNVYNPADGWFMDWLVLDSSFENNAVLLCVDIASNYIVPICLSDKCTTKEVVTALCTNIIGHYGQFLCLGTDGQSSLVSEMMAEICEIMRVRRFVVSAPQQSNAERAHRYIIWMLAAIRLDIGVQDSLMPVYLAHCALLYNTSIKTHQQITPYFLMNGLRSLGKRV